MGYAKYIGRVGGLAVTLGVGIAVATTPGAAWADDTASSGAGTTETGTVGPSESEGTLTGGATPETTGTSTAADSQKDGASARAPAAVDFPTSGTSASMDASVRQAQRGEVLATGGKQWPKKSSSETTATGNAVAEPSTDHATAPERAADFEEATDLEVPAAKAPVSGSRAGSDTNQRPVDKPTSVPRVDANTITATVNAAPSWTEPSESVRAVFDIAADQDAAPQAFTAVTAKTSVLPQGRFVAQAISAGPEESGRDAVSVVVLGVLAAAGLGPQSPLTPDSPLEWAVLAMARKFGQEAGEEESSLTFSPQLTSLTTTSTVSATVPTINEPNDFIGGKVTGSVNVGELDGNASTTASYTVTGQPTKGTVTVDQAGNFTYTPTQAAREAAAVTQGLDTDSFTVTVIDGQASDSVAVTVPISSLQLQPMDPAAIGKTPTGVVEANGVGYVANQGSRTVSVVELGSNQQVATIRVGTSPTGVAATSDGSRVLVTNKGDGTVSVIDTSTNKVISTIKVGSSPTAVAISPVDGKTAYVVNSGSGTVSVLTATKGTYQVTRTITVGSSPTAVAVGTDGRVYVARSAGTVTVIANPTSSNFSVSTIQLGTGTSPTALAVTPDGKQVYVANSGTKTVSVIDTSSQTVINTIPLGGATPNSIAISSDGSIAYVATSNDTVMVIDTHKKAVINTVAIDPLAPETGGHVIAFGPGGGRIYISDAVDNKLRVVAIGHTNTTPQTTGEPTADITDPFRGTVTGSLNVIDVDGDKLILNTLTGPTSGTVTYDAATASYAYTPTAAARKAAAQTEQEDYDYFTVRAFDGLGFTDVEVRVPISPAPTISQLPIIRTAIIVNEYPTDIAVSDTYAYVVNEIDAGTMVVIDPATNTVVGDPIPVGLFPTSLVASEQGDRVYVADYGYYGEFTGVAVIDTDPTSPTYHEVTFVPVTVEPNPCGGECYTQYGVKGLAVSSDGSRVYAFATDGYVSVIDTATKTVISRHLVGSYSEIAVSEDGTRLYAWPYQDYYGSASTRIDVYDTATMTKVGTVDVMPQYTAYDVAVAINPDGTRAYAVVRDPYNYGFKLSVIDIDPNSLNYNKEIEVINVPTEAGVWAIDVALNSDGSRAYVLNHDGQVTVIDTTTNQIVGTFTAYDPGNYDISGSIDVGADGTVYVTDTYRFTVYAVTVGTSPQQV